MNDASLRRYAAVKVQGSNNLFKCQFVAFFYLSYYALIKAALSHLNPVFDDPTIATVTTT